MRDVKRSIEELTATTALVGTLKTLAGTVVEPNTSGHSLVYAGVSAAEVDADASIVVTKAGVLATDFAIANLVAGATPTAVKSVVCTADTITITLTGNGGAGTQAFYAVFRP